MGINNVSVDIVIVNWNSGNQLLECLNSIYDFSVSEASLDKVVVVDNASSDDSISVVKDRNIDLPILFIENEENRGFGAACNQGAVISQSEYILFLNPDTRLYAGSIDECISLMKKESSLRIGICGVQLVDEFGKVSRTCARFPSSGRILSKALALNRAFPRVFSNHYMTEWNHQDSRVVDQVMGAFFLVRRSLFQMLGGFDERFFVYFEEVDFSLRAKKLGWDSVFCHTGKAYHKGGGVSENIKSTRLFYSLRSRILYSMKHFTSLNVAIVLMATLIIEPISRAVLSISSRNWTSISELFSAYFRLYRCLPSLFRSNKRST